MKLILASASPRRAELLRRLNADFIIKASDADETWDDSVDPRQQVMDLARRKAGIVAVGHIGDGAIIIGADTVVVAPSGECLGKPVDPEEAKRMLGALSGAWHTVYTGVALVCAGSGREMQGVEGTQVKFRVISEDLAKRYLATGEHADKAGAYAVQGYGALLVEGIRGCYFNVMGLPLARLADMLSGCGYTFF